MNYLSCQLANILPVLLSTPENPEIHINFIQDIDVIDFEKIKLIIHSQFDVICLK